MSFQKIIEANGTQKREMAPAFEDVSLTKDVEGETRKP